MSSLRQIGAAQVVGVLQAFLTHTQNPIARQSAQELLEQLT